MNFTGNPNEKIFTKHILNDLLIPGKAYVSKETDAVQSGAEAK